MTRAARVLLAVAVAALPPAWLQAQGRDDVAPLAPARVAAQVVLGTVATPVGFVAGGVLTSRAARRLGASEDRASQLAYVGAWTGAALTTSAVPAAIGARGPGRGSYAAALGGALAGGAASWLLVRLNRRPDDDDAPYRACRIGCILASVAIFTLPSVGATVAYDASRGAVR